MYIAANCSAVLGLSGAGLGLGRLVDDPAQAIRIAPILAGKNRPVAADHKRAVLAGAVGSRDAVVHVIHGDRKRQLQTLTRFLGQRDPRGLVFGSRDLDLLIAISLDLPTVFWMRLLCVDDQVRSLRPGLARKLLNLRRALAEAGRRIRSENDHQDLPLKRRKLNVSAVQL